MRILLHIVMFISMLPFLRVSSFNLRPTAKSHLFRRTILSTSGRIYAQPSRASPSFLGGRLFSTTDAASQTTEAPPPPPLPTNDDSPELLSLRHSSSHVLAQAVQQLYPHAQVTIGPWIDNGFYYDFYFPDGGGDVIDEASLKKIKKQMDKIISANLPIVREEVTREEARRRIEELNEPFKLEILDSIKTEPITIYHTGEPGSENSWWDLCAGPHVESTGKLPKKAIELQSIAGAYWRGDEKREMLQRVYATAWHSVDQLKQYKNLIIEAKKRDHRLLGKTLSLFSIQGDAGGGLVFWHPKGAAVRTEIENFWRREHEDGGYEIVYTPHVANIDLWKTSGHYDFYKDGMFDQMDVEGDEYQIKPMNCPFHCLMYKDSLKSYRDLPIRWAELGTVYRYEKSGTLHGLMRVRGFTQDDAHIFCLPSQLEDEIVGVLDLTERILSKFGFDDYQVMLSTRPEKSVGSDVIWSDATSALEGALRRKKWDFGIDEGGGAFYGPKIDIKIRDALGRTWQCSTVQCDFNLPERFGLEYKSDTGEFLQPIMVHRAIFGSIERFFGILVENCAGDFPLWLAPVQLKLLPVTAGVNDYCEKVKKACQLAGIRVEIDPGRERLPKQIRNAEKTKIPLMAVVGMEEVEKNGLSIRSRKKGDLGFLDLQDTVEKIREAINGENDDVC